MKLLTLILSLIILVSCEDNLPKSSRPTVLSDFKDVEVMIYDSCEYVVAGRGKYQWGAHKGNCKNPIHKEIN
jgi:hypothetical protein